MTIDGRSAFENISPNVAIICNCLSLAQRSALVDNFLKSPAQAGHVVRAGVSEIDLSLRRCREHDIEPSETGETISLFSSAATLARERFAVGACSLNGPFFLSYGAGGYFGVHRDTASHPNDPSPMRRRALSLVLYVNGRDLDGSTPTFDGGALVVYEMAVGRADRRYVIVPEAGSMVVFRSQLTHEVREVREGVRYAIVAWLCLNDERDHARAI